MSRFMSRVLDCSTGTPWSVMRRENDVSPSVGLASPDTHHFRLLAYFAGFFAIISMSDPSGGLIDIPISFILKNQMNLDVRELAVFRLVASIPLYLAFLFGLLRDKINARRDRDRDLMIVFSFCNVAAYLSLSMMSASYTMLLVASMVSTGCFLVVLSAQSGMTASLAQRHTITGSMSATWNFMSYLSSAAAFVIGGSISQWLATKSLDDSTRSIFLIGAAASFALALFACARPKSICAEIGPVTAAENKVGLKALLGHAPIYPALGVWLLWNFAPGAATPLQYYMQNSLGASDAQWGLWNAVFTASFLPAFVVYGVAAQYVCFRRLLLWSAIVAVPQFVPLLFVATLDQAMLFAVSAGFIGGMATAAYLDLLMRSCPPGLHGTLMMASTAGYFLSTRLGDLLGSYLYGGPGGFVSCVIVMSATYASIVIVLYFVPAAIYDRDDVTASASAPVREG